MSFNSSLQREWLEVEFQLLIDRLDLESSKEEILEQIAAVKDELNNLSNALIYGSD